MYVLGIKKCSKTINQMRILNCRNGYKLINCNIWYILEMCVSEIKKRSKWMESNRNF